MAKNRLKSFHNVRNYLFNPFEEFLLKFTKRNIKFSFKKNGEFAISGF